MDQPTPIFGVIWTEEDIKLYEEKYQQLHQEINEMINISIMKELTCNDTFLPRRIHSRKLFKKHNVRLD